MKSPVLQSPEVLLSAIVESSDDAIISMNLKGIITSWNNAAEKIFGYTAAEALDQPITIIIPPDRLDEEKGIFEHIRRGERIDHFETVRRAKDGSLRDISLTISPIKDERGEIIGASKIARDITEQRKILHELRRSEERFHLALASIGDGVLVTDAAGRVTFLNAVAEQLTGWPRSDAVGRPITEVFTIVNEFTREPVEDPVAKALREGRVVGLANHTVLLARDGRERPIDDSGAPVRDLDGGVVGVVLVFRDVTARRQADLTALRMAAIVEHSVDAIIGKDLRGVVTSWNSAAGRIFGYAAEEMIGQSITRLIPEDRRHEEQEILAQLQRGELVEPFETIRVRKDGGSIWVRASISPIKDREGRIVGASKIARDITDARHAEQALRDAHHQLGHHARELEDKVRERTAELEEKVVELEAFSYSLSHDLRAPLRAITSFAEIVLADSGPRLDAAGVSHLQRVMSAAQRMDRMIQDVLVFSRVSHRAVTAEPVDMEKLFDEIMHERPEFQPPRAEIVLERPLRPVLGHTASLTQCLTNLLDNAVKFVAPSTTPRVRLRTEEIEGEVRLWVEDNGIGIAPEAQRRLFALFQRVHTAANYQGTGVGLAIVRRAAERMNGRVGVESEPGKGSRFWLQLPQPPKSPEPAPRRRARRA
jgi:PAS domain S-box-containing protein